MNAIIPFGALALGVVLYTLFHPGLRKQAAGPGPEGELPLEEDEPPGADGGAAAGGALPEPDAGAPVGVPAATALPSAEP